MLSQAKEEMRAKEALLKNFFANVDVVLRTQKVAATGQRWEVRTRACRVAGPRAWRLRLAAAPRGCACACTRGRHAAHMLHRAASWAGLRKHYCPLASPSAGQEEERQLQRELDAAQRRVHEALCDNINTQVGGAQRWW